MSTLFFTKNQKYLIGFTILAVIAACIFYFFNLSTHLVAYYNNRTTELGMHVFIGALIGFYGWKLFSKNKSLRPFAKWLLLDYISFCFIGIIYIFNSIFLWHYSLLDASKLNTYLILPLCTLRCVIEIIETVVLLKITKSFRKSFYCWMPIVIAFIIFSICSSFFLSYLPSDNLEITILYYLLTFDFVLILYVSCASKHPGMVILMIGRIVGFIYDFTVFIHTKGEFVHPLINFPYFVKIMGHVMILIGVIALFNNFKLKASQLLFKPNSINTLLPITLTLFSVLGAVVITFLPVYLSNYSVSLDPDLKGVFGASLATYLVVNLLVIKLIAYFTYRPINAIISSMKSYFSGQTEAPVKKKYFAAEYAFVNHYMTKSFQHLQERDTIQHELNDITKMFSHDIKSPLSVIQHLADSQIKDSESKKLVTNSVETIKNVSNRILKYKKGEEHYENQPLNLATLINTVGLEMGLIARNKNINLYVSVEFENEKLMANIDEYYFKLSLSNIINNAIEASSFNSVIKVNYSCDQENHYITVIDQGKGIPKNIVEELKNKAITYGKKGGHGIGLLTVKKFLKVCRGEFSIDAQPQKGTCVSMTIPVFEVADSHLDVDLLKEIDVVFIDDDKDVLRARVLACTAQKIKPLAIHTPHYMNKIIDKIAKDTLFVIDYDLSCSTVNGFTLAEELYSKGFTNIYISTGHKASDLPNRPFVKGILNKYFELTFVQEKAIPVAHSNL
jgi:signal transduction histidine kinase